MPSNTLLHTDLRPDNMLYRNDGSVVVLDWAWPCSGGAWVDLVSLVPPLLAGGIAPEPILATHSVTADTNPAAITAFVCALSGYWARNSRLPAPPCSPNLRVPQAKGPHRPRMVDQANLATRVVGAEPRKSLDDKHIGDYGSGSWNLFREHRSRGTRFACVHYGYRTSRSSARRIRRCPTTAFHSPWGWPRTWHGRSICRHSRTSGGGLICLTVSSPPRIWWPRHAAR